MKDPFQGISELQKTKILRLLRTHTYTFNKNEDILEVINNSNVPRVIS